MKYRIVEKTLYNGTTSYEVQRKVLFFWVFAQYVLSLEDAKAYIDCGGKVKREKVVK